jgi:ABC-type oligopeptide transport system substrate-binding subunit
MKWLLAVALLALPQEESTLRVAWGLVRTVDPALAIAPQDVRVAEALFDGLGGAEAKAEGAVVTFKLPARKWSDGRPVTASDYRFAWMRCLDPSTGSPWAFRFRHIKNARAWHDAESLAGRLLLYESEGPAGRAEIAQAVAKFGTKRHAGAVRAAVEIEKNEEQKGALAAAAVLMKDREDLEASAVGIKAVDERTLQVTLELPRPGFAELAATSPFLPVPEHVVTAKRDQWIHPANLVTCGTWGVEKWTRDGLVLARLLAGGGVAKVAFATADRASDAWALYERGSVDWLDGSLVPPEKIEALAAAGEIRSAPGASVSFLRLNDKVKPGLRRAIAMTLDRAPLAKRSGPGSVETRSLAGGGEGPPKDLAAAMTALAGEYPDLKVPRLRLLVWKDPAAEDLARAARDQLEESLALSIRIDLREAPPYQAALAAGDYDLALASFAPEAGDSAGILDLFTEGRRLGEKALLESGIAVPLVREGEWFAAKPRVNAKPGVPLSKVGLKK